MKVIITCFALLSSISLKAYEPKDLEHYIETKECMKCDLRGVSLMGQDLKGSNLRDADLSGSHLAQCVLDGSDLSGTKARTLIFQEPLCEELHSISLFLVSQILQVLTCLRVILIIQILLEQIFLLNQLKKLFF